MALTFGKRDVAKMAAILDGDYETVEQAAEAALDAAMQIIESKAKFTVVGQVKQSDRKGDKIALGWYGTANQAMKDALSLTYSTQTHEEHLAWVLPLHHGTPNSYYQARKAKQKAQDASDSSFREQELQRRIKWCADNPGEMPPKEWGVIPEDRELTECPMCSGVGKLRIDPV